jgi:hypothetical protein
MVKQCIADIRSSCKQRKQRFIQLWRKRSVDATIVIVLLHVSFHLQFIQSHRRSKIPINNQLVGVRWQLLRDFFDGLIQNACPPLVFHDNFVLDLCQASKSTFSSLSCKNTTIRIGVKYKINYLIIFAVVSKN